MAKRLFREGGDQDSAAAMQGPSFAPPASNDCMDDLFASTYFDEELSNLDLGAIVEARTSPKKDLPSSSSINIAAKSNTSNIVNTTTNNDGLPVKTPVESTKKKRQQTLTLFQTATTKTKRRKSSTGRVSSASVRMNTLTQEYFVKKDNVSEETISNHSTSTSIPTTAGKVINGLITIKVRGKDKSFKAGDVFIPHEKKYREKGFVFTLRNIISGEPHEAYVIAWMKIENAFLGPTEAAAVKECTGSDWVLVKKHHLLPESGRLQLRSLGERLTENLPSETNALLYEQSEDKIAHSFYYETNNASARAPNKPGRPIALDLFAGAGGTSIGLESAGLDVKYKVEMNITASNTLQINFPDSHIFCEDIAKFLESSITRRVSIYPRKGQVAYIHGSPPCQVSTYFAIWFLLHLSSH